MANYSYFKDNTLDTKEAMRIKPEGAEAWICPSYYKIMTINGKEMVFRFDDEWVRSNKTVKEVKHPSNSLWMRNYTR